MLWVCGIGLYFRTWLLPPSSTARDAESDREAEVEALAKLGRVGKYDVGVEATE